MRLRFYFALIGLVIASQCCRAMAATPVPQSLRVPDSAAPTFSIYSSRDGLSDEVWSTVGFGPQGFVWAGSASGLARFDGYRWTSPVAPPGRSLVRDMANDADGNLWAIFESEGLVRFDGQRWQRVGEPRFYQRFSTVGSGERKELWAAHNEGVAKLVNGVWVDDPGNDPQRIGRAIAFARTQTLFGAPREWLGSNDSGLWFREISEGPGPWQRYEHPELSRFSFTDLMVNGEGDGEALWAVSYGHGVARMDSSGTRLWRSATGELPSEAVYSAVDTVGANGQHTVWMASRAGLLRFRGDSVEVFDRRHGLPADAVRGLKVQHGSDGLDTLWIATEGGLARATLADSPWHTVSLLGSTENGTFGLLLEPNGRGGERLWVGSAKQGLALLDDGEWRSFTAANGLPPGEVRGVWRLAGADGRDHRLLSVVGAPLTEISDTLEFRSLPTPWPVTPESTLTFLLSRQEKGEVEWWAGTSHRGIWRLRAGQWQPMPILEDTSGASVSWITEQVDRAGRSWLWAADTRGLARYDGTQWVRFQGSLGLPNDGFRALAVITDATGQTLWASSAHHGLLRLDVSDASNPKRLDATGLPPPPDPTIYSILPDSLGRIYLCTNNGVQQLTTLPAGGYSERVFRRRDGLVHDECNTNSQFVDSRDRYWVGTLGGLGMFDPRTKPPTVSPEPKILRVTELRVDGNPHAASPDAPLQHPANLRELRIEYSLLTGQREGENRYRTQLLGFEPAPTPWTRERSRSFTQLPAGDYALRIEARDFAGTMAVPLEVQIKITPLWWQQRWLQGLVVLLSLVAAAGTVLSYNRGLRSRERQLRHQVAERTQDLHSANLRLTELSYLDPLTGIANRRRLIEAMGSAMERAHQQGKSVGLIVADVDHFKQYNDRHGHLAGDAALRAIADALDSAMREQDLVARFGGEEFACLMVDANLETVTRVAERMRALVEALPPRSLGNDSQTLTISAGVISVIPAAGQAPEALIHAADIALYEAKAAGRNRVMQG